MPAELPPAITIITATPEDWAAARAIRLEALLRNPEAFGSTYAESVGRSEAEWRAWVERPGGALLLALGPAGPVGIVGALRDDEDADARTALIVSMYVAAEHRGRGVGRALMTTLLARLAADPALERARLHVMPGQQAARQLYAALGFAPVGEHEGEIIMERALR
ncbi:MAG: GNAT family N-acetyltransferase [Thermomicrobiales bacterium]